MTSNVGRVCGNEGHNFVSSGNSMTIVFKSDNSNTGKGFRFRIQSGHFRGWYSHVCYNDNHKKIIEKLIKNLNIDG